MSVHIRNFIHGSFISLIGAVLLGLLNYLVRRWMANGLPLEQYGFFYSAMALCSTCIAVTEFGTKSAGSIMITKYLASHRRHHANATFSMITFFNMGMSLLIVLGLGAASPWLMRDFFKYDQGMVPFAIFLVYMLFSSLESIVRSGLAALREYFYFNLVNVVRSLLLFVGVIVLMPVAKVDGAALAFVISIAVSTVLAWKLLNGRVRLSLRLGRSPVMAKRILRLCGWMTLSGTGMSIIYSADTICLTWLGNLNGVALYNIALPLMQLTMSVIVMPMVFVPIAAELWQLGRYREIRRYCLLVNLGLMLALPLVVGVGYLIAPWVITLFFGAQFVAASGALVWLWGGMVFFAIGQFNITALDTGGMQRASALMVTGAVVINIVLNLLLIPWFGINGAAAATAAAYFFTAFGTTLRLYFRLKGALATAG